MEESTERNSVGRLVKSDERMDIYCGLSKGFGVVGAKEEEETYRGPSEDRTRIHYGETKERERERRRRTG